MVICNGVFQAYYNQTESIFSLIWRLKLFHHLVLKKHNFSENKTGTDSVS